MINFTQTYLTSLLEYIGMIAPGMVAGFLASGLIHEFAPEFWVKKIVGRSGLGLIFFVVISGALLPLCSWAELPLALSFYKKGAKLGPVLAFLLAAPATSIISLILAYQILGLKFVLFIFCAVMLMGVLAGIVGNHFSVSGPAQKKEEPEELNKAKSDFCASMSHELRTPLNAVIGFTQLISDEVTGKINDEQRQCLTDILDSSQHLLNLINDVMDLTRIEAGKLEFKIQDISLSNVVNEAVQAVRPLLENNRHAVEINFSDLPDVRADRNRLRQVLFNLLHNAIKFTPPGGKITVQACQAGDCCQVSVVDTGIGIKKEDQERIFEAFVQVDALPDRTKEGAGLGLALVKQLVEVWGGKIWVESDVGKGSAFEIYFPAA